MRETGVPPNILGSIRYGLAFQNRLQRIPNLQLLNPIDNLNRLLIYVFKIGKLDYNFRVVLLHYLFGIQTRGGLAFFRLIHNNCHRICCSEWALIFITL